MSKQLVAYFSASGATARLAKTLAQAAGADLYEILPETPYSKADLDWTNKSSRSSLEMKDPHSRPALGGKPVDPAPYDTIFLGFPIWWYVAPTIINTFLESVDLEGKTIVPFATSGSRGMGGTNAKLQPSCPHSKLLVGRVFPSNADKTQLENWIRDLAL